MWLSVVLHGCRKVLKQIAVAELQPDETVDAVREARLLAKVSFSYCLCECFTRYTNSKGVTHSGSHLPWLARMY